MRKRRINYALSATAFAVLGAAVACTEDVPTTPTGNASEAVTRNPNVQTMILTCEASRKTMTVKCYEPQVGGKAKGGPSADIVYGGQNVFVKVTTSNVVYNSGTGQYSFQTSLQNLLQQPIGTTDGTTLDPNGVRVFFASGPTVTGGSGVAAVFPDGFGTFTAAGQPFYQYNNVLTQNQTSPNKGWLFIISPTVETFSFILLISAPVQFPLGYIEINGQLPGACFGPLHPGNTTNLVGVVKNHLGIPIGGATITWGTTDPNQASVDGAGTVTGVRYGTPMITATSGALNGSMCFNVTGTVRNWTGATSTNWEVGTNWAGGYTPALVDTAHIPAAPPNQPTLTMATNIGGIQVDDVAKITHGGFNLTLSALAITGPTAGSGVIGNGTTLLTGIDAVQGLFRNMDVSGSYHLTGTTILGGTLTVTGLIQTDSQLLQVDSQ